MNILKASLLSCATALLWASCSEQPKLNIALSDKFEGRQVELINFLDSTSIASGKVENGKLEFITPDTKPVFTAVTIDGRTRAFSSTKLT